MTTAQAWTVALSMVGMLIVIIWASWPDIGTIDKEDDTDTM